MIEKMTQDKILGYQLSNNLKNGVKGFSYQNLDEDLKIMETQIVGAHFSFYEETIADAMHLWLLEENYEDFLNNHKDFFKDNE